MYEPTSRSEIEATQEAERRRICLEHKDVGACRSLWAEVIERTVRDLRFLQKIQERDGGPIKKFEAEKLDKIHKNPPLDFLNSSWFEHICDYLEVDPDQIRQEILDRLGEVH